MKPISISEQMMFNTVKLTTASGSGTGFFFTFRVSNTETCPVIITNKHVVNDKENETVKFTLHLKNEDDSSSENITVTENLNWHFHPKSDLCFCFIQPIIENIKKQTGKDVFYGTIKEDIIPSEKQLKDLSQLEEVVMVGYPIGLEDEINNFPIFRKGYTATHPAIDFNGDKIGLVDMACFPGSSGSPIFILNENGYTDKKGTHYMGTSRFFLLGIQYAVPFLPESEKIEIEPTKTILSIMTKQMINLGYYIKSSELLEFKEIIKTLVG